MFSNYLYHASDVILRYVSFVQTVSIPLFFLHDYLKPYYFYLLQGKFEETIKECTKALELNPKYIKVLHRRGEAHEKLEHFDEAIAGMMFLEV